MKVLGSGIKEEFKLPDFLFWVILAFIFPTVTGNFTLSNIIHILIYVGAVYFVAEKLLNRIEVINKIPSLLKIGLFIIFGSIVCGIAFMLISFSAVLYLLFLFFLYDLIQNKAIKFSFSFYHFLCIAPFFIILFQTYELEYAIHERYNRLDGDYYYYTAIVESLKTNQSLSSAIFHLGLPLNYPALPFMAPAELSQFSGISSQFALWGVFMKLVPISCLSIIAYTIVKIYSLLFNVSEADNKFPWKLLFTSFLLIFLGPIHFLNLSKLDFKNVLFLGDGYLLPTGSPGFAIAMWVAGLVLLMILSKTKYSLYYKIIVISLFCFALFAKIALFLPLAAFAGFLSLLRLFKKEKDLFFIVIVTLPCSALLYKLLIASSDSIMKIQLTTDGYFQKFFLNTAEKYGIAGSDIKKIFVMASITIFMWLSIKLIIIIISGFNLYKKNYKVFSITVSILLSFIVSMLPGFFVRSWGENNAGKQLFDGTFDMEQFARGGIFVFTIIALIFVLYLLYNYPNLMMRRLTMVVLSGWGIIICFSIFSSGWFVKVDSYKPDWYTEVKEDFAKAKPQLMAMMGNINQSGQTATTAGVHPWFCTGTREDGGGFVFSKLAYDRNYLFKTIFNSQIDVMKRKSIADSIRHLGVDCIVASPTTIKKINVALKDSIISAIPGTKWFYRFNN